MPRVISIGMLALLLAAPCAARLQGAKGRRLQVLADLVPYVGGELILEPTEIQSSWESAAKPRQSQLVVEESVRRHAEQFLHTRLRAIPWRVHVVLEEGVKPASDDPTLRAKSTVLHQVRNRRLLLSVDFVDARTGELVATFAGYGSGGARGPIAAARDDLQEITRVLLAQLAAAMEVGVDRRFVPDPYRRRPSAGPAAVGFGEPAMPVGERRARERAARADKDRDRPVE